MFDTDLFGRTHFSSFFRYIDMASGDLFESMGIDPNLALKYMPVAEAGCKFKAPTQFGDLLEVKAYPIELKEKALKIIFQIHRMSDGVLVAEGYQVLVAIDNDGRATVIPDGLRAILAKNLHKGNLHNVIG
jgi:acyl-CoA thioesterase FadM